MKGYVNIYFGKDEDGFFELHYNSYYEDEKPIAIIKNVFVEDVPMFDPWGRVQYYTYYEYNNNMYDFYEYIEILKDLYIKK